MAFHNDRITTETRRLSKVMTVINNVHRKRGSEKIFSINFRVKVHQKKKNINFFFDGWPTLNYNIERIDYLIYEWN